MTVELDIAPDLAARIDALAARSGESRSQIIQDALEKGHSIEWQERFVQKVEMAIEAADRGEFASQSDVDRVLNKYRPG
jgi:predicted transcriptional regulator